MKNNLLDVLNTLATHAPSEFLAPVPDVQQVVLFTLQNDIQYRFTVRTFVPAGWHYFQPSPNRKTANSLRDGQPFEIVDYLAQLPRIFVVAVFRVSETSWMVIPNNLSDAAQRGWKNGAPRILHLVAEDIQPFDVVVARSMAGTLLYDELSTRQEYGDSIEFREKLDNIITMKRARPELELAHQMMTAHQAELHRLEQARLEAAVEAVRQAEKTRVQNLKKAQEAEAALHRAQWEIRAREALGFMGAQLVNWTASVGDTFNVTWEYNGRRATTRINRDLVVVSAGFCLSGTDREHSLGDIVRVMEDAVAAGRTDGVMREYRGYDD